jgi:hypothetical protein
MLLFADDDEGSFADAPYCSGTRAQGPEPLATMLVIPIDEQKSHHSSEISRRSCSETPFFGRSRFTDTWISSRSIEERGSRLADDSAYIVANSRNHAERAVRLPMCSNA